MDFRIDDPCVLFALSRESQGFRREFPPTHAFTGAPRRARFCGPSWLPVLVMETGIGPQHTLRALDWLCAKPTLDQVPYKPKLLLFAGFAGSLVESLHVGDLVLAITDVVDLDGSRLVHNLAGANCTAWYVAASATPRGPFCHLPIWSAIPKAKRRLGQTHGALAVDMESAAFARICSERGIPFGCLRAISDDVETPLSPRLVDLLAEGQVSVGRVLLGVLRQPFSSQRSSCGWSRGTTHSWPPIIWAKLLGELLTRTLD